ncbi:hypothetical protein APS67_005781 [Streptomyces sp. AVP053U2]|nr:hypothetical protein APS67_005781 [Streptomyces sp. AVP053U2]
MCLGAGRDGSGLRTAVGPPAGARGVRATGGGSRCAGHRRGLAVCGPPAGARGAVGRLPARAAGARLAPAVHVRVREFSTGRGLSTGSGGERREASSWGPQAVPSWQVVVPCSSLRPSLPFLRLPPPPSRLLPPAPPSSRTRPGPVSHRVARCRTSRRCGCVAGRFGRLGWSGTGGGRRRSGSLSRRWRWWRRAPGTRTGRAGIPRALRAPTPGRRPRATVPYGRGARNHGSRRRCGSPTPPPCGC